MNFRRAYVTLMELLIVISILSLVAGVLGVSVARALREQKFKTELSQIVNQLRLAQDLMLIYNSNVRFKITKLDDGIDYHFEFDTPVPAEWAREMNRKNELLHTIQAINLVDKLETEDNLVIQPEKNTVSVKFLSGGSRMSRGYMRISTSSDDSSLGSITRYICLPGRPAPIVATSQRPDDDCGLQEEVQEQQLTRRVRDEIGK